MKKLTGVVIAQNNPKTVAVNLIHYKKHPKYKKVVKSSKKVQVHYENLNLEVGHVVTIEHSRPFSATKRFRVTDVKLRNRK